jgi:hypothetical protein
MELFTVTLPNSNVLMFYAPPGTAITPELIHRMQKEATRVLVEAEPGAAEEPVGGSSEHNGTSFVLTAMD